MIKETVDKHIQDKVKHFFDLSYDMDIFVRRGTVDIVWDVTSFSNL